MILISSKMMPSSRAYKTIPEIIKFLKLFRFPGIANLTDLSDLSDLFNYSEVKFLRQHIFYDILLKLGSHG